jgi:hypothetical protein
MLRQETKKIELILIFSIFLLLFLILPSLGNAKDCSHCWCQRPDGVCEHHTHKDPPGDGSAITNDTQCNEYCNSRGWSAKHCDASYIDQTQMEGSPCSEEAQAAATAETVPFTSIEPRLSVPEIDLKFSATVTKEGEKRYITVPYLAEYIAAIYQYMVGVATIMAIVMIMYGGFRWITAAGNPSRIGEAKKTIVGAVVGLAIALGSYTILNLINPDLVTFKALKLEFVEREVYTFDEASFGFADDSWDYDTYVSEVPATVSGFVSFKDMMKNCPTDKNDPSKYLDNYGKVVTYWIDTLPKKVVYVGGGTMRKGNCQASKNDNYLTNKLAKSGYKEWGGDINAYRAWAASLGTVYCGDCLTFSRTLYQCVVGKRVINKKLDKGVAKYYYDDTDDFLADAEAGKVKLNPGTFIWLGGNCGHAINYTGIPGKEIIEMGGGPPKITINGHRANSVRVKPSLVEYLNMKWIKKRDCPIYIHSILEFPDRY